MKLRRRNHFLPGCYQEGFTDFRGLVWVKFAERSEPEHRNPRSVGRLRSLYIRRRNGKEDDSLESFFGKEVESSFAVLSQRIKNDRERFAAITGQEQGALARFVASQAVRTVAHKRCLEEQVGGPLNASTFIRAITRQLWIIMDVWSRNPPKFHFYTSLPYIGEHFISGDSPVVVVQMNDNKVWVPTDNSKLRIADLRQILAHPEYRFWVPLSPYVCACIQPEDGEEAPLTLETIEPRQVRFLNQLVRGQSKIFTLARDKEALIAS